MSTTHSYSIIERRITMLKDLIALIKDAEGISQEEAEKLAKKFFVRNVEIVKVNTTGEWQTEVNVKEQLGIPDSHYQYHILLPNQERRIEVDKTAAFFSEAYKSLGGLMPKPSTIEFINYGDTELVYVGDLEDKQVTILVGQPSTHMGTVKQEYDNLRSLSKIAPDLVVSPTTYYANQERECFISPYIKQARCIATYDDTYGAYIPDPYYRYEAYSIEDQYLVSKTIVANLIRLYNYDKKLALAECKIGGGDFMLEKAYDEAPHTEENTLRRMKLIAARKLINIELKDYIELLRKELSKRTYYRTLSERDNSILVNIKNRVPMTKEAIEDGITLGLSLRK